MRIDELPEWLPGWCRDRVRGDPVGVLFSLHQLSTVIGLRFDDGREVVVKARPDDGRAASCVAAQTRLAERGFPCPRPLTPAFPVGNLVVHAECFRPGGAMLPGESPAVAGRYARVFARLMAELAEVSVPPPLPNPRWVRWDHPDDGLWPTIDVLDGLDQAVVSHGIVEAAERARHRLLASDLPPVLGHADYEAQNLRWRRGQVWTVHDWDSLAWQSEAALVGAASGSFPGVRPAMLAPIESSAAFLSTYQKVRGRAFSTEELEIAWAAGVWPAAHHARWEALHGDDPVIGRALRMQAAERLERANA